MPRKNPCLPVTISVPKDLLAAARKTGEKSGHETFSAFIVYLIEKSVQWKDQRPTGSEQPSTGAKA